MAKHSAGPWVYKGYGAVVGGPEIEFARGKGRRQVACVVSVGDIGDGEWEANAALITAAPELLDMVDRLIHQGERCNWFGDRLDEELAQEARDLIAKATGKQP